MKKENKKSFLRNEMGSYMTTLGEKNDKVVIVNADLSRTCRNNTFVEKYPERAFNTGIAEQNMVSFAAGLAKEGYVSYAFSMAPFLTMRACEQCRTDVAYANVPVRLIGVYAGLSGGISGATHWAIEDCGIMTSIPNMIVLEPCDALQAKRMLDFSVEYTGPMYIRSSVEPVCDIYDEDYKFEIGGSEVVVNGEAGAILCAGVLVQNAIDAAEIVKERTGKQIRVIDMYSIKPIDKDAIIEAAKTKTILVAHDHNIYGGLGSMVSMVIANERLDCKFMNLGLPDRFVTMAHAEFLYHKFCMDAEGIAQKMINMIEI